MGYQMTVPRKWRRLYGVSYPATYEFALPPESSGLQAQVRKGTATSWTNLSPLAPTDGAGVDGARFDYANDRAYVSVCFDQQSDSPLVQVRFVGADRREVSASYVGVCKFYNDLNSACVVTCDDWCEGNHADFMAFVELCHDRGIAVSAGINAQRNATFSDLPLTLAQWSDIQSKIDTGLLEPTNHGRTHANPNSYTELTAFREMVLGSQDIADNLTVPPQSRMGGEHFVLGWIEPNGNDNSLAVGFRPEAGHVISRSTTITATREDYQTFATAADTFARDGVRANGDRELIADCNDRFDTSRSIGGIYHVYTHPWLKEGGANWNPGVRPTGQPGFDWSDPDEPFIDVLDHIGGHSDVWYVGWGHLYVYRLAALFTDVREVQTSQLGERVRQGGQDRQVATLTTDGFPREVAAVQRP